jgi:hypothetical protein
LRGAAQDGPDTDCRDHEPVLPALLTVLRCHLGARELRLRVDRSRTLTESFGRGELDAALVMDPYGRSVTSASLAPTR